MGYGYKKAGWSPDWLTSGTDRGVLFTLSSWPEKTFLIQNFLFLEYTSLLVFYNYVCLFYRPHDIFFRRSKLV